MYSKLLTKGKPMSLTITSALKNEPVNALLISVASAAASWAGRLVSAPCFGAASLLNGGAFGIITDRTARLTESLIAQYKVKYLVNGDIKPKINLQGQAVSYLLGGAVAFGVCAAAASVGLLASVHVVQAVALTVLAYLVRNYVPADRFVKSSIDGAKEIYAKWTTPAAKEEKEEEEDDKIDKGSAVNQ